MGNLQAAGEALDAREAGRVVATVIFAGGTAPAPLLERANAALVRLSLRPISERDAVLSTPEELAPCIPHDLRRALAAVLVELAGDEPFRRRVALAYVGVLVGNESVASIEACSLRIEPTNRVDERSAWLVRYVRSWHRHRGRTAQRREPICTPYDAKTRATSIVRDLSPNHARRQHRTAVILRSASS